MFHICREEYYKDEYSKNKHCYHKCYYIIDINPELTIKNLIEEIEGKFRIKEEFKLYKKKNKELEGTEELEGSEELEELKKTDRLSNYLYEIIYMKSLM